MKIKTISFVILMISLIVPALYAGTEIMEKRQEKQVITQEQEPAEQPIPYGRRGDWPVDDDEIKSPWSGYKLTSDDMTAGQVLYDPIAGMPFRVPEAD